MNPPEDEDQRGFVRNGRSIFSKRADDNAKRKIGRLEKFLKNGSYLGLSTDVILETPCFQLREDGDVDRHVFLGVTSKEFIMAIQHLRDYGKYTDILFKANVDLDLDGMELACSCPIKFVRFFLLDERAHKFAVCTSLGSVWYFEMCNTSDGSDQLWTKWREIIREQDNPSCHGYKTWKVSKEDAIDARKTAYNIEIEDELNFIRRPINFCSVNSIGLQYSVASLNSGKYKTVQTLQRKYLQHKAQDLEHNIDLLRELCICNFRSDDIGWNSRPKRSNSVACCSAQTNTHDPKVRIEAQNVQDPSNLFLSRGPPGKNDSNSNIARDHQIDDTTTHQETHIQMPGRYLAEEDFRSESFVHRSHSDCILGMSESLISKERGLHFKYSFMSFISESLPDEPHRAVDIVDIRFGRWGLKRTTLNQLHRIWKLRNVERLEGEPQSRLGLSDSDESITDLFEEFTKKKQRRRPIKRWKHTLKGLTKQGKPSLEQSLKMVAFPMCDVSKYKAKRWMTGASPSDFSGQVNQIHIDLFLRIGELDVINYLDRYKREQSTGMSKLLQFSRGLGLLIVHEVLESKNKTEQSRRLKFFMQACKVCLDSNDLHSTWALMTGIRLLPVSSFKEVWSSVINDHPDIFGDFVSICRVFSHLASHKYRDKLRSSVQHPAYLPWLPHLLWHIRHSLQRPIERTVKQATKKSGLSIPKRLRRKTSKFVVSGASWMTLHRDVISRSLVDSEESDRAGELRDCKYLESFASVLSSQLIKEVLQETSLADTSSVPQKGKKPKKSFFRRKMRTEKAQKKVVPKKKDAKNKLVSSGKGMGFFNRRASPKGKTLPQQSAKSETEQQTPVETNVTKTEHVHKKLPEVFEDKQQVLPSKPKLHRPVGDPSKRMSLFGNALEDDETILDKDSVIDKAVKEQLAGNRKGATLEFWLEDDEDSKENAESFKQKPSFFDSLFGTKASTSNIVEGRNGDNSKNHPPRVSTERMEKVQFDVHNGNTNQSHNGSNDVTVRKANQPTRTRSHFTGRTDIFTTENLRTRPTILNGSKEALQPRKTLKGVSFKDNYSESNHVRACKESDRKIRSKPNSVGRLSSTVEGDRNCSSSNIPKCCVVCDRSGCIFDGCGLEKLVELQLACLSYHLKSSNSLYSYIEKQSIKLARLDS